MKLTDVAIVAVDGFSPFHYSVPCMLFGDSVSETKRFKLQICAERPGLLTAPDGFALNASADFTALEQADIVVVPYWGAVHQRPPQSLLDSLVRARRTALKSSGYASAPLFSAMPGCWMANGRRPTGSLSRRFSGSFPRCGWISMRCTSMTSGSSLQRAPRRRSTAACISFASVSAASRRIRSPGV